MAETGSTNADLLQQAAEGRRDATVLFTDHQTAGRGRQNRGWHDEPGDSLLVSALTPAEVGWAPLIPLATGLAAVEAVDAYLGVAGRPSPVGLKWPNDVLVADGSDSKLAGILVEARTDHETRPGGGSQLMVVIGMGLNVRWSTEPPAEVLARGVTLELIQADYARADGDDHQESLAPSARNDLLMEYLLALDRNLSTLAEPAGPETILDRYRRRCLTIGRTVSFVTPAASVTGRAESVDREGGLIVVDVAGEKHRLVAGEAHHQPIPSAHQE